jgi:hypothetical protein
MRKREIKTTLKIQRLEILVPGRRSLQVFASICFDAAERFFGGWDKSRICKNILRKEVG